MKRKMYTKDERKYAKAFFTKNPIVIERFRCLINEPALTDEEVQEYLKAFVKLAKENPDSLIEGAEVRDGSFYVDMDGGDGLSPDGTLDRDSLSDLLSNL